MQATASTPPRGGRAAPLPPEARRAAIVDAVIPMVLRNGEMPTSREIARAAEVSEGTIFNVFSDKADLLEAVVAAAVDPARFEVAVAAIDRDQPFVDQLVAAIDLMQHRVVDIWRVLSIVPHEPMTAKRWSGSPAMVELLERADVELRFPPDTTASILRSLTLSLTHPLMVDEPMDPAAIADVFLHGAAS